jgi:ABC-type bacteriocin/lantibiotic exporter with double-glycine peptidase domain
MSVSVQQTRPIFRLAIEFLGHRVIALMAGSVILGLMVFLVELLMAFSIQSFFLALGLLEKPQTDHWLFKLLGLGDSLHEALVLLLIVGTMRGLFNWLQNHASSLTTVEFETLNRNRLAVWAFGDRSAQVAQVASLFNDKTVGAGNFVSSIMGGISRIIVALLLIGTLLRIAPEVTLISFALLGALFIPFRILSRKIAAASSNIHHELDSAMSRLLRGVKNTLLLHIYGLHRREQQLTETHLAGYLTHYRSYHFLTGLKNMLPQVLGIWLVCLITLTAKSQGALEGAQIIEYFYLFIRFVQIIGELANLGSYVSLTRPRFISVWQWWQVARDTKDDWPETGSEATAFPSPVGWEISGLNFSYPASDRAIFTNLDLEIAPGSTLVITGPSGSGKSTLIAVLLGLVRPPVGNISLLTNNARLSLEEGRPRLLTGLGYVGPESFIIPGTIRENLLYGALRSYTDQELLQALQTADCNFVFDFDQGLNHVVTEQGEGLSAGQKQRLALARALLRKPNVLILDEATANLDIQTEQALVNTLAQLKGVMTIVAVTHREALLQIADQRLVL